MHRFALTFRTLSVPQMVRRLEKSGFEITALLGDYRGRAWDPRADVWVISRRRTLMPSVGNAKARSDAVPNARAVDARDQDFQLSALTPW